MKKRKEKGAAVRSDPDWNFFDVLSLHLLFVSMWGETAWDSIINMGGEKRGSRSRVFIPLFFSLK